MNRFFLLYDEWEMAEEASVRAECALSRRLDGYCEGTGPAPSLEEIAQARHLKQMVTERLKALKAYLGLERKHARLI